MFEKKNGSILLQIINLLQLYTIKLVFIAIRFKFVTKFTYNNNQPLSKFSNNLITMGHCIFFLYSILSNLTETDKAYQTHLKTLPVKPHF